MDFLFRMYHGKSYSFDSELLWLRVRYYVRLIPPITPSLTSERNRLKSRLSVRRSDGIKSHFFYVRTWELVVSSYFHNVPSYNVSSRSKVRYFYCLFICSVAPILLFFSIFDTTFERLPKSLHRISSKRLRHIYTHRHLYT